MSTVLRDGTPHEAGLDPSRVDRLRDLCQTWVKDGVHPAISALVARRGVIAFHEAFGSLGPQPDAPKITAGAIFSLASLSKPFTATALMILIDDGLVGLTRPVQEYIPEFTGDDKGLVCVHHLLTHTSGFEDIDAMSFVRDHWKTAESDDASTWLRLAAAAPLTRQPGKEMVYGNLNYVLAGEIVRRVSGLSLADFVRTRIVEPLELHSTFNDVPSDHASRVVTMPAEWLAELARLVRPPGDAPDDAREEMACWQVLARGPAGLYSTAMDVAVFGQSFLNGGSYGDGRILSTNAVREMTRNQIPGIGAQIFSWEHHDEASWGLGWGVMSNEKWTYFPTVPSGAFAHSGGTGTILWCDPSHELVGVFLSVARIQPTGVLVGRRDLFANAVYAAVE